MKKGNWRQQGLLLVYTFKQKDFVSSTTRKGRWSMTGGGVGEFLEKLFLGFTRFTTANIRLLLCGL